MLFCRISKSTRDGPGEKMRKPGPGQYMMASSFGTHGKSMGVKTGSMFDNKKKTPGPGHYSAN